MPTSLDDLAPIADELAAIDIPKEILEVAEEIVDGSDVVGIEKWRLEYLVRFVLFYGETFFCRRQN